MITDPEGVKVGTFYKNNDGEKAHVVHRVDILHTGYPFLCIVEAGINEYDAYWVDSRGYSPFKANHLVEEWQEPRSVSGWYNIYPDVDAKGGARIGTGRSYPSEVSADIGKGVARIGCAKLTWEEKL